MESFSAQQMLQSKNWQAFFDILKLCRQASNSQRDLEAMLNLKTDEVQANLQDGCLLGCLYEKNGKYYLHEQGEKLLSPYKHPEFNAPLFRKMILESPFVRTLEKSIKRQGATLDEIAKGDIQTYIQTVSQMDESRIKEIASSILFWIKRSLELPEEDKEVPPHEMPKYIVPKPTKKQKQTDRSDSPKNPAKPAPQPKSEPKFDSDMDRDLEDASSLDVESEDLLSEPTKTKSKSRKTKVQEEPKVKRKYLNEQDLPKVGYLDHIALVVFSLKNEQITSTLLAKSLKIKKDQIALYNLEAARLGLVKKADANFSLTELGEQFIRESPQERAKILIQAFENTKLFQQYQHFINHELGGVQHELGGAQVHSDLKDREAASNVIQLLTKFLDRFCEFSDPSHRDSYVPLIVTILQRWAALHSGEMVLENPFDMDTRPLEDLGLTDKTITLLQAHQVYDSAQLENFDPQPLLSKSDVETDVIKEISQARGRLISQRLERVRSFLPPEQSAI